MKQDVLGIRGSDNLRHLLKKDKLYFIITLTSVLENLPTEVFCLYLIFKSQLCVFLLRYLNIKLRYLIITLQQTCFMFRGCLSLHQII